MTDIEIPGIEALAGPPTTTPWVPLWPLAPATLGELAYGELSVGTPPLTIPVVAEGSAVTVVTAPAVTVDGQTPVLIEFFCGYLGTGAAGTVYLSLWEGAVEVGLIGAVGLSAGTIGSNVRLQRRLTPSAGAHTYTVKAHATVAAGALYYGNGFAPNWPPAFIRISLAAPTAAPVSNPTYGTTFPASPANGQEHILVDSVTNPTYQWRFRYNANGGTYKWEFVGGDPALSFAAGLAMSLGSAGAWTTVSAPITIPRAGVYQATTELLAQSTAFTTAYEIHTRLLGSASGAKTDFPVGVHVAVNHGGRYSVTESVTLSAGETLNPQVWLGQATATNFKDVVLRVLPVRVS